MIPPAIFVRHQELLSDHEFLNRFEKELIFKNMTNAFGIQTEKALVSFLDKLSDRGPLASKPFVISKKRLCKNCGYHKAYNCESKTGQCVPVKTYMEAQK
jgi:hypothetical protein